MNQRELFEHVVLSKKGGKDGHSMLCDLSRDSNGDYRSACERSAWWAWQQACPEGAIAVPPAEYDKMSEDSRFLCALRNAGVDNWDGYEEAQDMIKEWDGEDAE